MGWSKERFEHELQKLDRRLRLRLCQEGDIWFVERKADHGSLCVPKPADHRSFDQYQRDRQGYILVMCIRRDLLGEEALMRLLDGDMLRAGGADKFTDQLEAQERLSEEQLEQEQSEYLQCRSEEIYDEQMYKQGDIVSNFSSKVGGYEPGTN